MSKCNCENCTCGNIREPKHYKLDGLNVESIDVIKAVLGKDGFKSFCIGNCLKYLIRAEKKNGEEDYRKCGVYLDWILRIKMENINIDRIGNDLADAYEEGYQQGVKENKENNKKLRSLQDIIARDAVRRREKVIAVDSKTFENIIGKEVRLMLTSEILSEINEDIRKYRGY